MNKRKRNKKRITNQKKMGDVISMIGIVGRIIISFGGVSDVSGVKKVSPTEDIEAEIISSTIKK